MNINQYQKTSNEIIEKSIDTTSKYQQQAINTFQSITNNFVELQKNLLETYQSVISRFLDVTSKSYRNNPLLHKDIQIFTTRLTKLLQIIQLMLQTE
jgi:hypothetical protein